MSSGSHRRYKNKNQGLFDLPFPESGWETKYGDPSLE